MRMLRLAWPGSARAGGVAKSSPNISKDKIHAMARKMMFTPAPVNQTIGFRESLRLFHPKDGGRPERRVPADKGFANCHTKPLAGV